MYAVIRAGGKQYRVAPGDVIQIDRALEADKDGNVEFGGADVLAVSSEAGKIAKPNGGGASVTAEVLEEGRSSKVLVFKFKRKKQYKKMQGHRQAQTTIRVTEIAFGGEKATAPKTERKPKKQAEASSEATAPAKQAAAKKSARKTASKKSAAKKSSGKKK
jgi:large subunit ribosomal protein L21